MEDENLIRIGIACGEIADVLFPSADDRGRRAKLALALVDLVRRVAGETQTIVDALEVRVADLEKNSHAPADIASIVQLAIVEAFRRGRLRMVSR